MMSHQTGRTLRAVVLIALMAGGIASVGTAAAQAQPAGRTLCVNMQTHKAGHGSAVCTVQSGQARLRANCARYPDLYSPWVGVGTHTLITGQCPWGIRNVVLETKA